MVCLHVPNDRLDVVAGEHARVAVAASFPPVGIGVVQDLDEVAASESKFSFLLRVEVEERLHKRGMLWDLCGGGIRSVGVWLEDFQRTTGIQNVDSERFTLIFESKATTCKALQSSAVHFLSLCSQILNLQEVRVQKKKNPH